MAGLDNIKYSEIGSSANASSAADDDNTQNIGAGPLVEMGKTKGMNISGKIPLGAADTSEMLQKMQALLDERQNPMSTLLSGLQRASAWGSGGIEGPHAALTAMDRQRQSEQADTLGMYQTMAAMKAANEQAKQQAELYKNLTPGVGAVAGAPTATTTMGGITISPEQMAIEASLPTAAEKLESRRKFLGTRATESTKKEFAPGMADIVDIYVPGQGNVQMTKAQAEKLLTTNPNLQAIVGGTKVPAAQAISQPAATGAGIPAFTDPSIKIVSAQRTPEKGKELYQTSVAAGTPGIQPSGLPVAKPGTSPHETRPLGEVLDVDSKKLTQTGRLELAQKGYYQPYGIDSPHWEKVPTTTTPVTTARPAITTAQPAQQPTETRAQYEQRIKETGQIGESRIKEGEAERKSVLDSRQSAIETGNAISRIETTLNTEAGARAVGQFSKPGVVAAFGKILSEGIQAGNFGSVSFKGLEDAVRTAGGDQDTIDAAQRLARDFAQMQLNIAKRDLKGQGAVSDNERKIVERVTGSTSNSPEVLKDFARWNRVRNTFDKQVGDAYQTWEKANPNQNYYIFKDSDTYKRLENDYIAKTDAMASKMGVTGAKATPSGNKSKIDELLKQYTRKKES